MFCLFIDLFSVESINIQKKNMSSTNLYGMYLAQEKDVKTKETNTYGRPNGSQGFFRTLWTKTVSKPAFSSYWVPEPKNSQNWCHLVCVKCNFIWTQLSIYFFFSTSQSYLCCTCQFLTSWHNLTTNKFSNNIVLFWCNSRLK